MQQQKFESHNLIQIERDKERLLSHIWKHQETLGNGPIDERVLRHLTGWNNNRFEKTLYLLLIDPKTHVKRTQSGKIEYSW